MERKVKYDLAFKLKCVKSVVDGHDSVRSVLYREGIHPSQVQHWVESYEANGIVGLVPRKNQSYASIFKLKVLKTKELENGRSSFYYINLPGRRINIEILKN